MVGEAQGTALGKNSRRLPLATGSDYEKLPGEISEGRLARATIQTENPSAILAATPSSVATNTAFSAWRLRLPCSGSSNLSPRAMDFGSSVAPVLRNDRLVRATHPEVIERTIGKITIERKRSAPKTRTRS